MSARVKKKINNDTFLKLKRPCSMFYRFEVVFFIVVYNYAALGSCVFNSHMYYIYIYVFSAFFGVTFLVGDF